MSVIVFNWGSVPPSRNNAYFVQRGRLVLTTKGKAWKNSFILGRGGKTVAELMCFAADQEQAYALHLWFYFPYEELYNYKYGHNRSVKSPFKDFDVDNLIKLPMDAIARLVGIRDRNNFTVCAHKREDRDGCPRMVAVLFPIDESDASFSPEQLVELLNNEET